MSGSGNILFLKLSNKGGNPEYSDHQKYGPIAYGVGEIPLNEKGITSVALILNNEGNVVKKWSNLM